LDYFDKPAKHANLVERQNKRKKYKTKFSIISILKNKIDKNNFEKIIEKPRVKKNIKKYYSNLQYFIRKNTILFPCYLAFLIINRVGVVCSQVINSNTITTGG